MNGFVIAAIFAAALVSAFLGKALGRQGAFAHLPLTAGLAITVVGLADRSTVEVLVGGIIAVLGLALAAVWWRRRKVPTHAQGNRR